MKLTLTLAALLLCHPTALRAEEAPTIDPESVDDVTLAISRLMIETPADEIPDRAYEAAKAAMMDALGCAFGGHSMPGVLPIVDLTNKWGGRADATIWFDDTKVPVPAAAFVNSVQLHALDFDDYHGPSDAHMTSVLVPTVLTTGELQDASGQETLAALVLGAEVIGRLGRAHKARKAHSGFLPTSVIGGFGATAAACRLQGCSVEQTVNALGIWYAHASGNRQALFDRTLTKRIQPGIAARAAIFAACLADRGLTGPRRIVGGQTASLIRIYGCWPDAEPPSVAEIMRDYETWQIEQLQFKGQVPAFAGHLFCCSMTKCQHSRATSTNDRYALKCRLGKWYSTDLING